MISIALPRLGAALASARSIEWPIRRLGPYSCIAGFALLAVLCMTLSRAALIGWQWERVDVTDSLWLMLLQGVRNDLMTVAICAAPAALVLPVFVATRRINLWTRMVSGWLAACLIAILFLEFATPQFLLEYDTRPNRLFVEYLVYPQEVAAMLWNGYRGLLLLTIVAVAALTWLVAGHFRKYAGRVDAWRAATVMLAWPLVMLALFGLGRSSFQHRPANLASFAFCDDAMVNSLVVNSAYSVLSAVYGLKNESQSSQMYGNMPHAEMVQQVRASMGIPGTGFTSDEWPTLHRQVASVRRDKPLNLVIVLEESLGAGFVKELGGK
ncbi:MAG TPA: hypothetical protein VKB34_19455, partial [Povalibacter sp.]|nr:hypothetical protein [Povalibacter sp.]